MHALTSRNVWFPEQKWRDTGLTLFSCLMSANNNQNIKNKRIFWKN